MKDSSETCRQGSCLPCSSRACSFQACSFRASHSGQAERCSRHPARPHDGPRSQPAETRHKAVFFLARLIFLLRNESLPRPHGWQRMQTLRLFTGEAQIRRTMEERFFSLGGEKSERSNAVVHVSAGRAEDIVATTLRTDRIGASACSV
jgi:hypothetical protein